MNRHERGQGTMRIQSVVGGPHGRRAARPRAVLSALLLGTALAAFGPAVSQALAQAAPPAPPPVTVSQPLRREIVEWDEFTGQFAAIDYVEVRARVAGYLESIHFTDGQLVKKGDLLFVIDPRPFEAVLASAQAQVTEAQARLELANRQLARARELRRSDTVSVQVLDERMQEMQVAAAGVEVARANVRTAELDVGYTRITAPMDGRISKREVSIGNLIAGGSAGTPTLLTTIVSLDPIYFEFDMSEGDYLRYNRAIADGRLKPHRDGSVAVEGRLFDDRDWPLKGRLTFVDNRVDRTSGTIRARASFPNPALFITPGQFGRLRLPGSEPYTATLVPDGAVLSDQASKIVMTVAADGTVVPKPVRLGPIESGLRVVRGGLAPEDKVVINGLVRARPGSKVTPQPGAIEVPALPK